MVQFCEIAAYLGLSFTACETEPIAGPALADQDQTLFAYIKPPPPEPEPPAPEIQYVTLPPVVVEREVVVDGPAPPPETIVETEYVEVPKVITPPPVAAPSPFMKQVRQAYLNRYQARQPLQVTSPVTAKPEPEPLLDPGANTAAPLIDIPAGIDPDNSNYQAPGLISTSAVDNSRIVPTDRYITGIIEGGVNSQLAGEGSVVIQTSRPVFGYHNRNILIPMGSRLTCNYAAAKKVGQTRIGFDCTRILLGGSRAEIYQLNAQVGNVQGYAGLSGEVHNRWWEKYGTAVLVTALSASVQGATLAAASISPEDETQEAVLNSATAVTENFGTLSAKVLEDTVDLKPIIRISQGTRVQIKPQSDWYLAPIN